MSLARIAAISAVVLVVAWVSGMLVAELDIVILAVPFFALMMLAAWALAIVVLVAAFRRWARPSGDSSGPSQLRKPSHERPTRTLTRARL